MALPSRIIEPGENVQVPRTQDVQPDAEAEARMLDLINVERLRAGLRPLVADERLREVARQHSQEMFRLGYFAHVSPSAGSPADRLQRSGVAFATAGENLAYAPTVEVAHSGLMASPGHRQATSSPRSSAGWGSASCGGASTGACSPRTSPAETRGPGPGKAIRTGGARGAGATAGAAGMGI